MDRVLPHPKAIAERGEKIYNERYRVVFEAAHPGHFAVIDVVTEQAYVGATPEAAYEVAHRAAPRGLFHLIKIGEPGAFRVSHSLDAHLDWVFR